MFKKFLLLSILILVGFFSFAQTITPFPNDQPLSNSRTLYHPLGALKGDSGIITGTWPDTIAANASHIAFYNGAIIRTSGDGFLWYRNNHQWVRVGVSSASAGLFFKDGLISADVSLLDSTITIANGIWRRNDTVYSQTGTFSQGITRAAIGYYRNDVIWIDSGNVFHYTAGVQDTVNALLPSIDYNGIQVTVVHNFGATITPPAPTPSNTFWTTQGNNIPISPGYLGTTNASNVNFISSGITRGSLNSNGSWVIGDSTVNSALVFDIRSTTKGARLAPMTAAQRLAISSPAIGTIVFDTDSTSYFQYTGVSWQNLYNVGNGTPTTPSWQQTLSVSNIAHSAMVLDTAITHLADLDAVEKNWITIPAMDTADHMGPFLFGQSATGGETHSNPVAYFGWNMLPGGGINTGGQPALAIGMEQRWRPDAGTDNSEFHIAWANPSGLITRVQSFTLSNLTNNKQVYFTVDRFGIRKSAAATNDYFQIFGDADTRSPVAMSFQNSMGTLDFTHEPLTTGSNAVKTTIHVSNVNDTNTMYFQNYNYYTFNEGIKFNLKTTGAAINIFNNASAVVSTIQADNIATSFTNNGSLPFEFETGGVVQLDITSTANNNFVPVTIGSNATPVGWLAVRSPDKNIAGYFENTYGTGTKYGVLAQSINGVNGRALYGSASGNSGENIAVYADAAAGASNYAIYAPNTAQSFFGGNTIFSANGTPGSGKVATGTDGAGNWTWQTISGGSQDLASVTAIGNSTSSGIVINPGANLILQGEALGTGEATLIMSDADIDGFQKIIKRGGSISANYDLNLPATGNATDTFATIYDVRNMARADSVLADSMTGQRFNASTHVLYNDTLPAHYYAVVNQGQLSRALATTGSGTLTSVATGYGLSGGTITTSGTLLVDSATLSSKYLRRADSILNVGWTTLYQHNKKGDSLQTNINLKANIASPTFTGTVTIPTPFTLGATSVTSTGTQLNYLNAATGTTGTTSTSVVFSASPTITGTLAAAAITASSTIVGSSSVQAAISSGLLLSGGYSIKLYLSDGIQYVAPSAYLSGHVFTGSSLTNTSGASYTVQTPQNFAPTSGTGTFAGIHISNIINQTGGASGATRGLWVDPTLTAASDYRGIEVTKGSIAFPYVAKTSTYSILNNDYTVDCTSGTFTATLPTAVGCAGRIYVVTNSGAGTITIATTSSQTFANVAATPTTLTMATVGSRTLQSNGANWLLLSSL
jgi:hypothetical protein